MLSIKGGPRFVNWKDWQCPEVNDAILISCKNNFTIVNNLALIIIEYYLLKSLGIPTPRNPHYQALVISLLWLTPQSYPVTEYLASQEYNRDISLASTIQE
jgi:hypothetical protein